MAPDFRFTFGLFLLIISGHNLCGQNFQKKSDYKIPPGASRFYVAAQTGYGITTSNFKDEFHDDYLHGITVAFSLGYRCTDRLYIEAGPAFWLSANDLFDSNAASKEKPVDKRTLVTLAGAYSISRNFPLTIRIGAGAGNLVFTPQKQTINAGEDAYDKTEIIAALGGMAGISYPFRLSSKASLYTGFNCWYMDLQEPQINYKSTISCAQSSVTAELFVKLHYLF